jgi:hypothetical protein
MHSLNVATHVLVYLCIYNVCNKIFQDLLTKTMKQLLRDLKFYEDCLEDEEDNDY